MHAFLRTSLAAVSLLFASCSLDSLLMLNDVKTGGITAEATIVDTWDTGWTVNDDPVIGMHVEVHPANGPAFRAAINRTLVSRIDVPQFQPGKVVPVRYDPADLTKIAIDRGTGNPYHDDYQPMDMAGRQLEPPQPPVIYRGTASANDDFVTLLENGYIPVGVAVVARGGENPRDALVQATDIGARVVVLYGEGFAAKPEVEALPFHHSTASSFSQTVFPELPAGSGTRMATFWGKNRPWSFGLIGRELKPDEQAILRRKDGVVAAIVPAGSPVAEAGIVSGDVVVAVDGKPVHHAGDLSNDYIRTLAGKSVKVDILRGGVPSSVTVNVKP